MKSAWAVRMGRRGPSFHERVARMGRVRDERIRRILAAFQVSPAVVATGGKGRWVRERLFILTRCMVPGPCWRVTEFDLDGPTGHVEGETPEKAVLDIAGHLSLRHVRPVSAEEADAWTQTPEFRKGVWVVAYVQAR